MAVLFNKERTEMIATCGAGDDDAVHIIIEPSVMNDDETYAYISYMNGNFYRDQDGALKTAWHKLKKIWAIIADRDFYYSEVLMDREEFKQFKQFINEVKVGDKGNSCEI